MSFTLVSNSTTAMCVDVNLGSTKFFCHAQISNGPIYLPLDYTPNQLREDDRRVALVAESAQPEYCWSVLRALMCENIARPCSVLTPPTDSGLCKSTCNNFVHCNGKIDRKGDFLDLCNDESYVVDDTRKDESGNYPLCGGKGSAGKLSASARYLLIATIGLNIIVGLATILD